MGTLFFSYMRDVNRGLETKRKTFITRIADKGLVHFAAICLMVLLAKYAGEFMARKYSIYKLCNKADITQQERILCQTEKSN